MTRKQKGFFIRYSAGFTAVPITSSADVVVSQEGLLSSPPPTEGNRNSEGRRVQQETISEEVGSYLQRFFPPGGLSKTDESSGLDVATCGVPNATKFSRLVANLAPKIGDFLLWENVQKR